MEPRVLRGNKREIAESVARMDGEIHEAIVFVEAPADPSRGVSSNGASGDLFAEMDRFTVHRGDVNDSRESIYRRAEGE